MAAANSPLPSASMVTAPSVFWAWPQAPMTKGSLTATQATVSTPLARMSSARSTKPGRWWSEHVGVNAPGTANSTTLPEPSTSPLCTGLGPSAVIVISFTSGILSPTEIAIDLPPQSSTCRTMHHAPCRAGTRHAPGRSVWRPGAVSRSGLCAGSDPPASQATPATQAAAAGRGVVDQQGDDGADDRADHAGRLEGT